MALSAFQDKSQEPSAGELSEVLDAAHGPWRELVEHVVTTYPPIREEWRFAGAKYGWSLRLVRKDRVVLYLTPRAGSFLLGVVLGEKAVRAAHDQRLPDQVLALLDAAPRYAEGRGIRLEVATTDDIVTVRQLAALKMSR